MPRPDQRWRDGAFEYVQNDLPATLAERGNPKGPSTPWPANPPQPEQADLRAGVETAAAVKYDPNECGNCGRCGHCDPPNVEGETCRRCGGSNVIWSAASPLWNYVMRGNDINGDPRFRDLVCMPCFVICAVEAGLPEKGWRLTLVPDPEGLIFETPSGRVWDPERFLWVEPALDAAVRTEAQVSLRLAEHWCHHCGLRMAGREHCADARNLGDPTTWQGRRCPAGLTTAESATQRRRLAQNQSEPFANEYGGS